MVLSDKAFVSSMKGDGNVRKQTLGFYVHCSHSPHLHRQYLISGLKWLEVPVRYSSQHRYSTMGADGFAYPLGFERKTNFVSNFLKGIKTCMIMI